MRFLGIVVIVLVLAAVALRMGLLRDNSAPDKEPVVVCYAALDEEFSRPILEAFEKETGVRVDMKFDTESTKSVGLANALVAEKSRPRCDVFWNNEIVNTLRLKKEGVLAEYRPPAAQNFPDAFKDDDGMWTGFAARCRVLIVNTDLVSEKETPRSLEDLLDSKWKGKIGIAKPLFGTTATWLAALYATDENAAEGDVKPLEILTRIFETQEPKILSGNKACATTVGAGDLPLAFTDTDDAMVELEVAQKPVRLVYFDNGRGDTGALFIPNTLAIIKDCPHRDNAELLVQYLLSPHVEKRLAESRSAQIPVNPAVKADIRVKTPAEIQPMKVDWDAAAAAWDQAMAYAKDKFLR